MLCRCLTSNENNLDLLGKNSGVCDSSVNSEFTSLPPAPIVLLTRLRFSSLMSLPQHLLLRYDYLDMCILNCNVIFVLV